MIVEKILKKEKWCVIIVISQSSFSEQFNWNEKKNILRSELINFLWKPPRNILDYHSSPQNLKFFSVKYFINRYFNSLFNLEKFATLFFFWRTKMKTIRKWISLCWNILLARRKTLSVSIYLKRIFFDPDDPSLHTILERGNVD